MDTVIKAGLCKSITFSKATIQDLHKSLHKNIIGCLDPFPLLFLGTFFMAHMKTLLCRNWSHQEHQTLEGELLKIELLGSQCSQGLGQYSYYGQTT